jgi:hypothetical protein
MVTDWPELGTDASGIVLGISTFEPRRDAKNIA